MRQPLRTLGTGAVLLFLLTAFTPLPNLLSRLMTKAVAPSGKAAAIVVLGGGGLGADGALSEISLRRTYHGVRLHHEGLAPLLVFSGTRPEAAARAEFARDCGVPARAIVTEATARTTREEAAKIEQLLRPRDIKRILLVADAEGMARATRVFEKAGFEVRPAPTADVSSLESKPEVRLALMRRVAIEWLAWPYYWIAGYF